MSLLLGVQDFLGFTNVFLLILMLDRIEGRPRTAREVDFTQILLTVDILRCDPARQSSGL